MVVTLDSKRRTKPGEPFEVDYDAEEDAVVFRRLAQGEDWLTVLEQCPVPMDDLPKRRREYFRSRLAS